MSDGTELSNSKDSFNLPNKKQNIVNQRTLLEINKICEREFNIEYFDNKETWQNWIDEKGKKRRKNLRVLLKYMRKRQDKSYIISNGYMYQVNKKLTSDELDDFTDDIPESIAQKSKLISKFVLLPVERCTYVNQFGEENLFYVYDGYNPIVKKGLRLQSTLQLK